MKALNDAIETREEGIIVKDPESTYRPDKRMGKLYWEGNKAGGGGGSQQNFG